MRSKSTLNKSQETKKNPKNLSFAHSTPLRASEKLSFAELFAASESKVPSLRRNQEVTGKIVAVSPQEVLVDIGAKSEGVIAGRELSTASDIIANLSVGDTIDATVLYPENDAGQVVLSLHKHSQDLRWKELEDNKESDEDIAVVALEVNRGGVICDFKGVRGFLPASQLLWAPAKLADLINKNLSARVIEVDRNSNRLILSQKKPDKKDLGEIAKLLGKVEIGQKLAGIVSAVLPFGIFVEVEVGEESTKSTKGIKGTKSDIESSDASNTSHTSRTSSTSRTSKLEGLVHVSEISWEKVDDPQQYFKVGDKTEVMVIAKEESSGRLNLSIKQLKEDPFTKVSETYTRDQEVKGTISRITPFGVIVGLSQGVEGLVHISKIPPNLNFEVGESISCSVESVDSKARRIALVPIVKEKPVLYR